VVSFAPGEGAPSTYWIGGCVDPRAGLNNVEKRKFLTLLGLELRPLSRPAHSQSLYRLRYPASDLKMKDVIMRCLVRMLRDTRSSDGRVWSYSEVMISRGTLRKLRENLL
jgi:hypothetical protein